MNVLRRRRRPLPRRPFDRDVLIEFLVAIGRHAFGTELQPWNTTMIVDDLVEEFGPAVLVGQQGAIDDLAVAVERHIDLWGLAREEAP